MVNTLMEGQAFGGHSELAMFDYEREYPLISHRMNDMFHHSPISCGKPTKKLNYHTYRFGSAYHPFMDLILEIVSNLRFH